MQNWCRRGAALSGNPDAKKILHREIDEAVALGKRLDTAARGAGAVIIDFLEFYGAGSAGMSGDKDGELAKVAVNRELNSYRVLARIDTDTLKAIAAGAIKEQPQQ